jgi:hypothetical protein
MVNGDMDMVRPLSPDMDMNMPCHQLLQAKRDFRAKMQLPQRRPCARPRLARTTRRSLAFLGGSDDPTDGLLGAQPASCWRNRPPDANCIMERNLLLRT